LPESLGAVESNSCLVALDVHDFNEDWHLALQVELEAESAGVVERNVVEAASPSSSWDVHDLNSLRGIVDGETRVAASGVGSVLNPVVEDRRTRWSLSGDGDGISEDLVSSAVVESGGVDGEVSDMLVVGNLQDGDEHQSVDLGLVDTSEVIQGDNESGELISNLEENRSFVSISVLNFNHDIDVGHLMNRLIRVVDDGQASVELQVREASEVGVVLASENTTTNATVGGISNWGSRANDPAGRSRSQVLEGADASFSRPGDVE